MTSVSQFPPAHLIEDEQNVNEQRDGTSTKTDIEGHFQPLALPAPSDAKAQNNGILQADDDESIVRFDHLGPLVVNTNGTLSRIYNWDTLSETERQTTLRVLVKRNKSRLQAIKAQEGQAQQEDVQSA